MISEPETRAYHTNGDGYVNSTRSGGGRDVTLTLPNGQRTTFAFVLRQGDLGVYWAEWHAAPGVTATLGTSDDTRLIGTLNIANGPIYWAAGPATLPMDQFDFSGFNLTTLDGTQYIITRDSQDTDRNSGNISSTVYGSHSFGNAHLSKIIERTGDTITIAPSGIAFYAGGTNLTKSLSFQRNSQGLISAIFDPNSVGGFPTVQYVYDQNQNLIQVLNLVDRTAGTYTINSFAYTNASFPHYITGIINADGTQVAKNFYDDSGRLTAVTDANGNTTQFGHSTSNNTEVVIDRLGNTNSYVYDLNGNVIAETNALGQVIFNTYDGTNNLLSTTDALGNTNSYAYDGNGNRIQSVDALGRTNLSAYDSFGNLASQTDPIGNVTTNVYDASGNVTNTVQLDPQGHILTQSSSVYQGAQLLQTLNASNQVTASFGYDGSGNLNATTNASGFAQSFAYDANGNQTNTSYVWIGSGVTNTVNTYTFYDAQGRVIQTIDADGNTNQTFYTPAGKVDHTIDKFGNVSSFIYDSQGNTIQSTYTDGTFTRTVYDANAKPILTTDRNGVTGTLNQYDALGRVTNTIRSMNVLVNIVRELQ